MHLNGKESSTSVNATKPSNQQASLKQDALQYTPSKETVLSQKELKADIGAKDRNDKALRSGKTSKNQLLNPMEPAEKERLSSTPFTAKKQTASTAKESTNVYKNGFFVHKTIRDLAIKPDFDFGGSDLAQDNEENKMKAQVEAIKKEVQSKAANLSPVLKNRSASKVNLKTQ